MIWESNNGWASARIGDVLAVPRGFRGGWDKRIDLVNRNGNAGKWQWRRA
jgi:hypothetical protein